ncbi:TetR/AcrR family transcriptional regulator [Amycolatopsis cihanbeyliensis]|uniref:TetR family transcriptional regulator n=1 Tax=Amycolatopsis cihanbeyliensis TaxID=1128664 RepID=A0A542DNY0_AMYCI|nr:TetR/AcrR family transcriptional regulator [Amycolatopsis cihanbeyliensis]TQJ04811.1 TetR family transcriptional regulator [Amycolatopsis cihanbeyliensis]
MNRRARAAETEAALKQAAKRVFARQGYLNTKITDITAEAGRAAGSFYNHFAGKEELLTALLTDMLAEGDRAVAEDPTHSADFTDRAAVRWHIAAYWRFYRAHLPEMIALRQASMVNAEFDRRLREIMAADREDLRDHLERVPVLPGDPELVISAMYSLLDQFAWTWLAAGGDGSGRTLPDDEAIDLLTDFLYRGIAGSGTANSPT